MEPDPNESGQPARSDTQRADAGGKGKGIATKDNTKDAGEQLDGNSIASRLGRSAAELSKSVLKGAPSANGLSSIASSGKPAASSASSQPGIWSESSFAPSASTSASAGGSGSAAFRSTQTNAHIAAEEQAFSNFLDNTSALGQIEPVGLEEPLHGATSTAPEPMSHGWARYAVGSSVAEQEERDGVEVVRLLSQANDEPPSYDEDVTISKPELENLRRALFESGSAQISASDWNNLLNFVPDFLRDEGGQTESSQMQLGVVDTSQAGQLWLEEWNRVLTSYTDEVWGDLGDLVQEARSEVEQIRGHQEKPQADPKSLRRLQSILTHVRARL